MRTIDADSQPARISLITPSFNQARFLEATMQSVLSQGHSGLQYAVVDGGSTDGSVDIIARHADRLAFWITEPDAGYADAINKGFARTSGDIMGWLNSSDLHLPWTLQTVSEVFRDVPEAQWIMGIPSRWSETGAGPREVTPTCWNVYDFLAGNYKSIQQESVFWRRSLWESAGAHLADDLLYAADFELWLRFMELAPLCHVQTTLAGFRVHDCRLGGTANPGYWQEAQRLWDGFRSSYGRRARVAARITNGLTFGGRQSLRRALGRSAMAPWYEHRQIVYDFEDERWITG